MANHMNMLSLISPFANPRRKGLTGINDSDRFVTLTAAIKLKLNSPDYSIAIENYGLKVMVLYCAMFRLSPIVRPIHLTRKPYRLSRGKCPSNSP